MKSSVTRTTFIPGKGQILTPTAALQSAPNQTTDPNVPALTQIYGHSVDSKTYPIAVMVANTFQAIDFIIPITNFDIPVTFNVQSIYTIGVTVAWEISGTYTGLVLIQYIKAVGQGFSGGIVTGPNLTSGKTYTGFQVSGTIMCASIGGISAGASVVLTVNSLLTVTHGKT